MKNDRRIQVLPENVANQIAAGEVVERPASVLKELMENALDAGASQVDAEIVGGGKTLVRVADNGVGMSRDDALLSIERFATSKIRAPSELERIETLGFRGEALAAISSVSRFHLLTRRADDLAGTEITMSAGKIQDVRDQGCAPGTVVSVRNLFFNLPARRKFLRSQQTELFHARQVFILYALSHPDAAMSLKVDGREIINLPRGSSLAQRLAELYPSSCRQALRPVSGASGPVRLTGYASLPTHIRSDGSEQHFFVNGRPTAAPVLAAAVREAYRGMLPRDRYPLVFLFISMDPALVDVNVHPTKKEVRFHDPSAVRNAIIQEVMRAISPAGHEGLPAFRARLTPAASPGQGAAFSKPGAQRVFDGLSLPSALFRPGPVQPVGRPPSTTTTPPAKNEIVLPSLPQAAPWSSVRVLGQVYGLYIVMETDEGIVLMDPHAAHERVLFERFMAQVAARKVQSHGLLLPETVDFSPRDAQALRTHVETLKRMGFGIAGFGGDSFIVDALPACLSEVAPARLLTDLAACLAQTGNKADMRLLLEEQIAQAACKSAVKAHGPLSPSEIESLIGQLAQTEMPYTCPHGRPTLIHISREELDRRFGRA